MQSANVWYSVKMLEHSFHESLKNSNTQTGTPVSKFFEYTEAHAHDGVGETLSTSQVLLETLRNSEGVFFEDVSSMYPLIDSRILVRREDVEMVMHSLFENREISIDPKGLYPNVAWWDLAQGNEGLKNAFLEGRAHLNGVVAVVGFDPNENLNIVDQKNIPDEPSLFFGADGSKLDRHFVASARGIVSHDDLRFIVFRFPYQHFPESEMTDAEVEGGEKNPQGKLQYIFRGIYLPKTKGQIVH